MHGEQMANDKAGGPTAGRLLLHNTALHAPVDVWRPGWLLSEGGRIRAIGPGAPPRFDGALTTVDGGGRALLPGFIDLHVHGAVGHEVMDADPDGLRAMARFYARHGVTAFLATTWTASQEAITAALEVVATVRGRIPGGATLLGVHLEGPYLNERKCGAQDSRYIRRAARAEALAFLEHDLVRLLALAPEFLENAWLIETCVRRGVTVSAAHTLATYEEMEAAVALGLRQATHTYNAMVGLGHRRPGTVGAVLTLPQLNAELIADTVHVHPPAMRLLVTAKGPERTILVTDAMRATGLEEGEYTIDSRTVTVEQGAVRLPDNTLAGSVLTMDRALRNAVAVTGRPLAELWPMSSLTPARAIGLSAAKGSLEVGKDADLVLLDKDGSVAVTVAEGEIVHNTLSELEVVEAL